MTVDLTNRKNSETPNLIQMKLMSKPNHNRSVDTSNPDFGFSSVYEGKSSKFKINKRQNER